MVHSVRAGIGYQEKREEIVTIKRVYVAGLLTPVGYWSTHPAIDYIINRREMIKWGLKTLLAGFDPFVPALDMDFWTVANGQPITEAMIKRYSKSWLEVCDAMVLTPGWGKSKGTLAEIKFAREKGIPVFNNLDDLMKEVSDEQ